ncbi:MurR/RpiR family transcriptional regulator [Niveispirillum sp.]|uniref:MurR/RpiR family transcriptional regulator n=1 Tax=Niveispirillum sp. TaxID=1917217 RepID=UPI001B4D3A45|nr:MurR/RpiR family transcriptional regulator [Niveispirillum sp.]MBP7334899.1 MurR/RpiR family transcriptional regulator [Niveispirillum sp.]
MMEEEMSDLAAPPATAEELRALILERYDGLSKRLKQIARFVLDQPNETALETLAVIAERTNVQPSAIIRFAKTFGFSGASQMQRLFRDGLVSGNAALNYGERVRSFAQSAVTNPARNPAELLSEFVGGNVLALQTLEQPATVEQVDAAIRLIQAADTIYVAGFRRSFPVASYLAYLLQQVGRRTILVDGVAGLARQQMSAIRKGDLLIGISYQPYAGETLELVERAVEQGADILAISDSLVSPIAKPATCVLQVREAEVRGFRSLAASICLAQALAIGLAFAAEEQPEEPAPKRKGKKG